MTQWQGTTINAELAEPAETFDAVERIVTLAAPMAEAVLSLRFLRVLRCTSFAVLGILTRTGAQT